MARQRQPSAARRAPAGSAAGGSRRAAGWWSPGDSATAGVAATLVAAAGVLRASGAGTVVPFVVSALALAALAVLVGRGIGHLGARWSPQATGVLQATVGNLPELLFGLFALRAGLGGIVQAAMVGSVLANVLLVLGTGCLVGGLRHGTQRFDATAARAMVVLLLVGAAIVAVPSVTALAHTAAAPHERALSMVAAAVLLVAYGASLVWTATGAGGGAPGTVSRTAAGRGEAPDREAAMAHVWPLRVALVVLVGASLAAAVVSDWFVTELQPALRTLGFSSMFTGVVVVAIAGNAVEHVGGVVLAADDRMDHAVAVILESPVQVLLGVFPLLVMLSPALGGGLTLALSPLLLIGLGVSAVVAVAVVVDGESTWVEGICLVALYAVVAAASWWGR